MNILSVLGQNKFWNVEGGSGMAHHNVRGNIRSSRSHGIMAHSGFGAMNLVINGQRYTLPMSALRKDGAIKKSWKAAVNSQDTKALLSRGAVLA